MNPILWACGNKLIGIDKVVPGSGYLVVDEATRHYT